MAERKKKKVVIVYEGAPAGSWMVTFSDMCTLLLTFFVLLYSMATLATEDFEDIFQTKTGDDLGLLSKDSRAYNSRLVFDPMPAIPKNEVSAALDVFREDADKFRASINEPAMVEIYGIDQPDGVVSLVLADRLLFSPGQTELTPESREFLEKVRLFLRKIIRVVPRRIIIEGHTDNTAPLPEQFLTSSLRAEAVLVFILEDRVLPPELFSMIGYGSTKPVEPNNSDYNRARNRRVRILIEPPDAADKNLLF